MTDNDVATLTAKIKAKTESNVTESFITKVIVMLDSIGCTITDKDTFILGLCMEKVEKTIINICSTDSIPEGLTIQAVNMVCGEFLSIQYNTGQLTLESLDLGGAIASVNVGGTSVSFDNNNSQDTNLKNFISLLKNGGRGELECYRIIKW